MRLTPILAAAAGMFLTAPAAAHPDHEITGPLRIAVVGLTHGHVEGLLWEARERDDIEIVGIWEPDAAVYQKMESKYGLAHGTRWTKLDAMLDSVGAEAVVVMTSTKGHRAAVEEAAPRGLDVMVEKPLATTLEDARAMADLAREHGIELLTNYETSWYASNHEIHRLTRDDAYFTPVRRVVFRHGHRGPEEIGVAPEFLEWLTDPIENGGGALFDFGCYGANIMTWLMDGARPETVSATVRTLKPDRYPDVDDDATIVLAYPDAVAVVQGSWAWTHDNKETVAYTEQGSLHAGRWQDLAIRRPDQDPVPTEIHPRPQPYDNPWTYLRAVVRDDAAIDPLSSLENNLIVMEILEAARTSAETGETVRLSDR